MVGVDKVLAAKDERTRLRKEKKLSGANVWKNRVHPLASSWSRD